MWYIPQRLTLFLTIITTIKSQVLNVVTLESTLPGERAYIPAAAYDGEDSIYIWGGNQRFFFYREDILKYNVDTDWLEHVGEMPNDEDNGSGVWIGNRTLLHFGGDSSFAGVYTFKTNIPSYWEFITDADSTNRHHSTAVWDGGDNTYFIGGTPFTVMCVISNEISKFSIQNGQLEFAGNFTGPRYRASAVWDNSAGAVYIFGGENGCGEYPDYFDEILKFDPKSGETKKLDVVLPIPSAYSCAIWTGSTAYIIGGETEKYNTKPKMIKFDPVANEVLEVEVTNFPADLYGAQCAFVEKLNRIYIFGGITGGEYTKKIWYVDLSVFEPSSTTTRKPGKPNYCEGVDDGTLLPNPYCCESYFQCDNGQAVLRHCPDFLQFNDKTKQCDFVEVVKCGTIYN